MGPLYQAPPHPPVPLPGSAPGHHDLKEPIHRRSSRTWKREVLEIVKWNIDLKSFELFQQNKWSIFSQALNKSPSQNYRYSIAAVDRDKLC